MLALVFLRPLSDDERKRLRRLARREVGRVAERIHMVLLSARGYPVGRIAEVFECDEDTVRQWLRRFEAQGVEGLRDRPRSGRPRKADAAAQAEIVRLVEEAQPERYGLLLGFWTVATLGAHLAQQAVATLGESTVRRVLRAAGFVWRRPQLAVTGHDPAAGAKPWAIAKAVVEAGPEAAVRYEDECDLHLLPVVRAMWQRRGQQVRVPTPGTNRKRAIFGALDIRTGAWHYALFDRKLAVHFLAFLEQLVAAYGSRPVLVIVDNYGIHHAQVVQRWLAEHPRMQVLFLPTYSPRLNPVEKVWWQLKRRVAANRCHGTLEALVAAVHQFFTELTPTAALQLAA